MGTDIHVIAQVKDNTGKWINNPDKVFRQRYNSDELDTDPPGRRYYDWFSVLADVRNGVGFAGHSTGQGFKVIAEPRGLPDDFRESDDQYLGNHSFSYLTLEDFDSFDWNQVTMKTGVITLKQYEELKNSYKSPDSWSGGVMGPNIVTISTEEADDPKVLERLKDKIIYVQYSWPVVYREIFADILESWTTPMRELKAKYGDVRVVFGFDS